MKIQKIRRRPSATTVPFFAGFLAVALLCSLCCVLAWSPAASIQRGRVHSHQKKMPFALCGNSRDSDTFTSGLPDEPQQRQNQHGIRGVTRRQWNTAFLLSPLLLSTSPAIAATRAVGSGEEACRAAGNCWQTGEWDGAVGWQWGGKDRCDALDPLCGPNGQLVSGGELTGRPVPAVPDGLRIRNIAAVQIEIGRRGEEVGVLKLGFYGDVDDVENAAVEQLAQFISPQGLFTSTTTPSIIGQRQEGVSLARGGELTDIIPLQTIEFGVPSQTNAFARSKGRAKVSPDDFCPQSRPLALSPKTLRPHDEAGLISIPEKGLGYGGSLFENGDDDTCFASAFVITADAVPAFDANKGRQPRRLVVGQVLDASSMAFLERLANLPTQRGIRGVLPGQKSGPPLPKVVVRAIQVADVSSSA